MEKELVLVGTSTTQKKPLVVPDSFRELDINGATAVSVGSGTLRFPRIPQLVPPSLCHLIEQLQWAFGEAALNGNLGSMKLLLALGVDVNEFECRSDGCRTPLIAAAQAGQYEAVQLLIARGADVNKRMKRGQSALMFASYYGHTELVRLLLACGANVNADFEGDTALSWARQKGHADIVNLLIATDVTR